VGKKEYRRQMKPMADPASSKSKSLSKSKQFDTDCGFDFDTQQAALE